MITDITERQRLLDFLGRPDPLEMNPVKVLYYGHSFVAHLQDYMATLPCYMGNFGLHFDEASVSYKSLSGASVDRLMKRSKVNQINRMQPEIVVLEVGTNDLSEYENTAGQVHDKVLQLVRDILDCRVRHVIVSQVLLRGERGLVGKDTDFENKVYDYNHRMEASLQLLPRTTFWHHRNLWRDIESHVEDGDGTHLNDIGHKKLYRSLKGGLKSTIRKIRPAWSCRVGYQ